MNRRFYDIYNGLYADYVNDFDRTRRRHEWYYEFESEANIIREIRRAIELAEMDIQRKEKLDRIILRPDAKFFLLSNFHLMVVRPLLEGDSRLWDRIRNEKENPIFYEIKSDISAIVREAYSQTREQDKKTISGHAIMRTIDKMWRQLKSTNFNIWGDDE
jgi:hypothetical protein